MQLKVNARLRVRRNVVTSIRRQLATGKSKVYVSVGQEVSPGDLLGEGQTPLGFRTIHLTRELGEDPKKAALNLKRKIGQTIFQGELLAERHDLFGLRKKLLLSPVDGVVDFYDERTGDLRVKLIPKQVKLVSGVCGVVDRIEGSTGTIFVRTMVSMVYGVLGSGKEREGILKILGPAESLTGPRQINETERGQIVVGGAVVLPEALRKATGLQVTGIIAGGVNAGDYGAVRGGSWGISRRNWSDVGISLMFTEGFGAIPIGEDIFRLLKEHEGKVAVLDGNQSRLILPSCDPSCMIYIRKAKLPDLSGADGRSELNAMDLQAGVTVRIVSHPVMGYQGIVETVDKALTELPSGIKTYMVTVHTKSQKVRVPYQNLEVIG